MQLDSFLFDKRVTPSKTDLEGLLGDSLPLWDGIEARLREQLPHLTTGWGWSGKKLGWSKKLIQKKRVILYMKPAAGEVKVSFAIGCKATKQVLSDNPPGWLKDLLENAQKFPEGFAVRLVITDQSDLPKIDRLVELKLSK